MQNIFKQLMTPHQDTEALQPTPRQSILFLFSSLLVALCLIPFYQVLSFDFLTYDDNGYIVNNSVVQSGLSWNSVKWALTSIHVSNWHPLTSLLFLAQVNFFGLNPMGFHGVTLSFHIANSILLFFILVRATKLIPPSFFAACLFAVHPMHVESVAWVSELKDTLSTFFALWTILLYVKHKKALKFSIFFVYVLSLLSKQMYVTLPILLLIFDFWPLHRFPREKMTPLIQEKIPYFLVALFMCGIAFWAQRSDGALQSYEAFPLSLRLQNVVFAYWQYILKMFFPLHLSIFYVHEKQFALLTLSLKFLALITTTALAYYQREKRPYLLSGWLIFIITLLPVIGIIQIGAQAMANRYSYFSYIGLFIMIFYFLNDFSKNNLRLRKLFFIFGISVSLAAAFMCYRETSYWKNTLQLFQHAVDANPKNYVARLKVGDLLYYDKKNLKEAKVHLLQVVALEPKIPSTYNILGQILSDEGDFEGAEKSFKNALTYNPNGADLVTNLATLYLRTKKNDLALEYYKQAIQMNPNLSQPYSGLLEYGKNTCRLQDIKEFLPRIFSLRSASPQVAYLANWFEKLKGETLTDKEQSCKEDKKMLEELEELTKLTKTLKDIGQIQQVYKTY